MKIAKAVITAAGRGARLYPAATPVQKSMLPVVDRDGFTKPAIQLIAEEAINSGAQDICIVCAPGDESQYVEQFKCLRQNLLKVFQDADWAQKMAARLDDLLQKLHFAIQPEPLGYGDAVFRARAFTAGEPFLLLLSDHLYLSYTDRSCAEQITELASEQLCSVAGVQVTRESLIANFGTLAGRRVENLSGVYEIERILEKPSVSIAEIELVTAGLRTGYYLCFFGIHVLTPAIFEILEAQEGRSVSQSELLLTPALDELAHRERYLAQEVKGVRYDLGQKYGLLRAQLALGEAGVDHDEILHATLETLADVRLGLRPGDSGRPR
ncbi:MAG: nucleotidyl transferase [Armatimonadetes bacterium]|nr:nucleotidyl transferase [Armatimonadota bacterium]